MKKILTFTRVFSTVFFLCFFLLLQLQSRAAVHTVTNPSDNVNTVGSLRYYLQNGLSPLAAGDVIVFNAPMTISLTTTLLVPNLTGVTIDATTITGWTAGNNLVSIVNGASVATAMTTNSTGFSIKGITFSGFNSTCLNLYNAPNFSIKSCFFGMNANATATVPTLGIGIYVGGSSYGIIGGSNTIDRNVFHTTAPTATCISLISVFATNWIRILGNKFGTNYDGSGIYSMGSINSSLIRCSATSNVQIGGLGVNDGNQFEGANSGTTGTAIGLEGGGPGLFNYIIQGNKIGVNGANSNYNGIVLNTTSNSDMLIEKNTITNTRNYAVLIPSGATSANIRIKENTYGNNTQGVIFNNAGTPSVPVITSASTTVIKGTGGIAGATIEIYVQDPASAAPQAILFKTSFVVPSAGNWSFIPNPTPSSNLFSVGQVVAVTSSSATLTATTRFSNTATVTACNNTANAGQDQRFCTTGVGTNFISLSGLATNQTGAQWTFLGPGVGGTYGSTPIAQNTTYYPAASDAPSVSFAFTSTTSTCSVSDTMKLFIDPLPSVSAGADKTICAVNTNVNIVGSAIGATSGSWSTSGTGTFVNQNSLTTTYKPSAADKIRGSVIISITSAGNACTAARDDMTLTIDPCLIDPSLSFESPTAIRSLGSEPFKMDFAPLSSTGAITYKVVDNLNLLPTSCAAVNASGFVSTACTGNVRVIAYQAQKYPFKADTAFYVLTITKGVTKIVLESRGASVNSGDFRLLVDTNYDGPLTYSMLNGSDEAAATLASDGLITPLAPGTIYVQAYADGTSNNYNEAYSNVSEVIIYPNLTKPVAVSDTLDLNIAEEKTIDIGSNDYGTTASINLSPMIIDIDAENDGVQDKYFRPGVGIFTVDSVGILTFTSFEAFIGIDSIQYTVTDGDGLVSELATVLLRVTSPLDEIQLKANEIITPNEDKLNDALVIGYTDLTKGNDLLVVDGAGNRLFYERDYQNNWYATDQSGKALGNGVYYFIFREFNEGGTVKRELKGNFTVIR
jgi:hypothetical protein